MALPRYVDLRPWMPPVTDQSDTNACAANAVASACEYIIQRKTGHYVPVSRLFIYYNGRVIDQRTHAVTDSGGTIKNVVLQMRHFGLCGEDLWPYQRHLMNKRPPHKVYEEAKRFAVTSVAIPFTISAIKQSLANQIPVPAGIKIKNGRSGQAKMNNGYISIPDLDDTLWSHRFAHGVLIVGYDDNTQHFIIRNSWGPQWGLNGYGYIPYAYLLDKRLVEGSKHLWTITNVVQRQHKRSRAFLSSRF